MLKRKVLGFESLEDRQMLTVPNFLLTDVNPTSPSFNQQVSPMQYAGKTSAWYFAHAT